MAKKKNQLDEFGFDKELSFDNFNMDFDLPEPKDDRSPTTKAMKGFASGVKDGTLNNEFARKFVKASLPRGYGDTIDLASNSARGLKDLYHNSLKDVKPVMKELKDTTRRILPKSKGFLPKSVADKLEKWSKEEAKYNIEDQRESNLNLQLMDVFKSQSEEAAKSKAELDARQTLKDTVAQKRHKDNISQLDEIRTGISKLVAYQEGITINYQRKSLELQFRSYYILGDLLEEQKKSNEVSITRLAEIVKNTGLPEYVKINNAERLKEYAKNKFIGGIGNTLNDYRKNIMGNFSTKLAGNVKGKVNDFAQGLSMAIMGINTALDAQDMMDDMGGMGPSKEEMIGSMIGAHAANKYGMKAGNYLRKKLDNSKYGSKIRKGGTDLQYHMANLPQYADMFSRGEYEYGDNSNSKLGKMINKIKTLPLGDAIIDVLKESFSGNKPGYNFDQGNLQNIHEASSFTNQTRRSITEVIPGFLSRIHQELKMLRTGSDSADLLTFDYSKNTFVASKDLFKSSMENIIPKHEKERLSEDTNKVIDSIDPDKTLSNEERRVLGKFLVMGNLKNKVLDPNKLGNEYEYSGEASKHATKYKDLFSKYFEYDSLGNLKDTELNSNRRLDLNNRYQELGTNFSDNRALMQDMINAGYSDVLEQAGLLKDGRFDENKLHGYYLGDEANAPKGPASPFKFNANKKGMQHNVTNNVKNQSINTYGNSQPSSGSRDNSDLLKSILEAVQDANTKTVSLESQQTLKRIEEIIKKLQINGGSGSGTSTGDQAKRAWYQMSVGDILGTIGGVGMSGLGYLKKEIGKGFNLAKSIGGMAGNAGKQALDWLTAKKDQADLWIKGEAQPRLLKWKLEAGHYIDQATGKVITSFEEIKGNVIDKDGNLIITMKDLKNMLMPKEGSRLYKAFKYLKDKGEKAVKFGIDTSGSIYRAAWDIGKKAFAFSKDKVLTFLAKDVYVVGNPTPKLLAIIMKSEGYTSQLTGKKIRKPTDIDGPVIGTDGNLALTEEDIRTGLVDVEGKPFKTLIKKGIDLAKETYAKISDFASKIYKGGKDFLKNGLKGLVGENGALISIGGSSRASVNILKEIRDILDERLPGGKPKFKRSKISGDTDNDGDRDNSWQDMLQRNKEKAGNLAGKAKDKAKDLYDSGNAKTVAMIAALKEKLKGGDEESSWLDDLSDMKNVKDMLGEGWRGAKSLGKKGIGKLGKFGKYLKGAGASGAARATGTLGTAGAVAKTGAGSFLKSALARLAIGAGGMALTGSMLGGAATIVGTLFSWPVTLAGLGAYGLYKGYKAYTAKSLDVLSTYRFGQYGFRTSDAKYLEKVFGLEDMLEEHVSFGMTGASINESKIKMEDVFNLFDISKDNKDDILHWSTWFTKRFKPVYLQHLAALKKLDSKVKLSSVDKSLSKEDKLKYFEYSKLDSGPYDVIVSPVPDLKNLYMTSLEVKELARITLEKLKANSKDEKKSIEKLAGASTLADITKPKEGSVSSNVSSTKSDLKALGAAAAATNSSTMPGGNITVSITGVDIPIVKLTPLNTIRYKAYGLRAMESSKVNGLAALEMAASRSITMKGSSAVWSGDIDSIIESVGRFFGVAAYQSPEGIDFARWFNARFLPVYLTFLSASSVEANKTIGSKIDSMISKFIDGTINLGATEQLSIANAIYSATGVVNGSRTDIWNIPFSPWSDYTLSSDKSIVENDLSSIKYEASKEIKNESAANLKPGNPGKTSAAIDKDAKQRDEADKKATLMDRIKDAFKSAKDVVSNTYNKVADKVSAGVDWASNKVSDAKKATGEMLSSAGNAINTAVKGVGGMIDSIPMPTASGTWKGVKDTINAAANAVGVDPNLMSVMAAIESGFNYAVKASTSSATGLYQFINSTWKTMVSKYGAKYGIAPGTSPTDPRANALMGAEFLKENIAAISPALGRAPTQTDLYLAHFMGAGGAKKFFKSDQNALGAQVFPDAAKANPTIFYHDGKGMSQPKTLAQIYQHFNNLIAKKAQTFGLSAGASIDTSAKPSATPAATSGPTGLGDSTTSGSKATTPPGSSTSAIIANDSNSGSPANTGTVKTSTVTQASPTTQSVGSSGGFNVNEQIKNQSSVTNRDMSASMGNTDSILTKSLDVQTNMLSMLTQIYNTLQSTPVQSEGNKKVSSDMQNGVNKIAPRAPISMDKTV